jgi:hypothetical protein
LRCGQSIIFHAKPVAGAVTKSPGTTAGAE